MGSDGQKAIRHFVAGLRKKEVAADATAKYNLGRLNRGDIVVILTSTLFPLQVKIVQVVKQAHIWMATTKMHADAAGRPDCHIVRRDDIQEILCVDNKNCRIKIKKRKE